MFKKTYLSNLIIVLSLQMLIAGLLISSEDEGQQPAGPGSSRIGKDWFFGVCREDEQGGSYAPFPQYKEGSQR